MLFSWKILYEGQKYSSVYLAYYFGNIFFKKSINNKFFKKNLVAETRTSKRKIITNKNSFKDVE